MLSFHWSIDREIDSSDHSDEVPAYPLWVCEAADDAGEVVALMGACDFGRDGEPWDASSAEYRAEVEEALRADVVESYRAAALRIVSEWEDARGDATQVVRASMVQMLDELRDVIRAAEDARA